MIFGVSAVFISFKGVTNYRLEREFKRVVIIRVHAVGSSSALAGS